MMERLACVIWFTRVDARLAALDHVLALLETLLDASVLFSLPRAVQTGSLRLTRRASHRLLHARDEGLMDRSLALHYLSRSMNAAIVCGDIELVRHVHACHPAPLAVDSFHLAVDCGHLHVLQWLYEHRTDGLCTPDPPGRYGSDMACCMNRVFDYALAKEHLHIAVWLLQKGQVRRVRRLSDLAAAKGDLSTLRCLRERDDWVMVSSAAMVRAVQNGYLDVIRFLVEDCHQTCLPSVQEMAIVAGHNEIVSYFGLQDTTRISDVPARFTSAMHANSAVRIDSLQRYHKWMEHASDRSFVMTNALHHRQVDVVKWLLVETCAPVPTHELRQAAERGFLDMLQCVHDHGGAIWNTSIMDAAAKHGHLVIVEWLHENRVEGASQDAMNWAASRGHLDTVKWLHAHRSEGCTPQAMDNAAGHGHLDVVQWLHKTRLEGCTVTAMNTAATNGHLEVVKWLHEHRNEGCTTDAMDGAAMRGHLEVVIWLHAYRDEGCTSLAINRGAFDVVQWLHFHRSEGSTQRAMDTAASNGNLAMLEFLHDHRADANVSDEAAVLTATNGHFFILKWLRARYSFDDDRVKAAAWAADHSHILSWLQSRPPP